MTVKTSWLVKIAYLSPLCLFISLSDFLFFGNFLNKIFYADPMSFYVFNLFFQTPHVVGSSIGFFDKDYASYYKKEIILVLTACVVLSVGLFLISPLMFNAVLYSYTVYHLIGQIGGIGSMLTKVRGWEVTMWKWFFFVIFLHETILVLSFDFLKTTHPSLMMFFDILFYISLVGISIVSAMWFKKSETKEGKIYLLSSICLVILAIFHRSYSTVFFFSFATRITHDVTGFYYYIVHDAERNKERINNLIYRAVSFISIPMWSKTIILSFLFALPFTIMVFEYKENPLWYILVAIITFFHYIMEGFIWKKDSLHRQNFKITTDTSKGWDRNWL